MSSIKNQLIGQALKEFTLIISEILNENVANP